MRKALPILLCVLIYFIIFGIKQSHAQYFYEYQNPTGSMGVKTTASIGEFFLNLSGWQSPFASIVLSLPNGQFMRATTCDQFGNFYFTGIKINKGFSGFCLTAVDFKRLGESVTCIDVPPAKDNITMKDIFLPPTLGLSRTEVAAGSTVYAFGYTMPNAKVRLNILYGGKKITINAVADANGYYRVELKNLEAGKYELYAEANYHGKDSLSPSKKLILKALSLWEQFLAFLRDLWDKFTRWVTTTGFGILWLGLPLLILIIILILKLWPERFTFIYESRAMHAFNRMLGREKKLHHAWWVGY